MPNTWFELLPEFPVCFRSLDGRLPPPALGAMGQDIPQWLAAQDDLPQDLVHLPDLARLEAARQRLIDCPQVEEVKAWTVNPALELLPVGWLGLPRLLDGGKSAPAPGETLVLVWRHPESGAIRVKEAAGRELLALKVVSEAIDTRRAAREGGVSVGYMDDSLLLAAQKGLLLKPPSTLRRSPDFPRGEDVEERFFSTPVFTLQWHLTQVCDLRCKHCYDRSDRRPMSRDEALLVLDQLHDFCRRHHVFGQISFTGGNPLLYPHFNEVYQGAAERGLLTAVLGNPMPRPRIEEMLAVQRPEFYQISIEGLEEHNDYIRGPGHFARSLAFLDLLRELGVYSMVMLTLTRANQDQVLPLAETLRHKADLFTFNRLSLVGEGAALVSAPFEGFAGFLKDYEQAALDNPCMGFKDSLFNLLRRRRGEPLFGGCAGHGCGAAFNFVSLLPDGEVHACRKFPSPIGNLHETGLAEIYAGAQARRYRRGSLACDGCAIRPVCGGCLAVAHGLGLDVFAERDPYCFV